MSFLKKLFGGSEQNSQQQSGLDPRFANLFFKNVNRAGSVADNLGARQFADFTPDYRAGSDQIRQTAMGGAGLGSMNDAASALRGATRYQPQQVSASPVTAGSFLSGNIAAYQNPYTDQVVNATMADLERQRQLQQVNDSARMTQANAFGNNRRGIAEAATNEAFDRTAASTLAGLRQQGFDTAANLMQSDMNRALQADTFSAGQSLSAQQANQQAGLAGQGQAISAASQLASVGGMQQDAGYKGGLALQDIGNAQQQLAQARLDAQRNLGLEQQAIRNDSLGLNVGGGSGMTSSGSSSGNSNTGIFQSISDMRAKKDIDYMSDDSPLQKLSFLRGAQFRYRDDDEDEPMTGGVMAQDVERVMPQAVGRSGQYKTVDYGQVMGLLVDAVNELAASKGKRRA